MGMLVNLNDDGINRAIVRGIAEAIEDELRNELRKYAEEIVEEVVKAVTKRAEVNLNNQYSDIRSPLGHIRLEVVLRKEQ